MNPVHDYFGFKMRWNPTEVHHFWWGILGVLLSLWGIHSALVLNGLVGGVMAPILVGVQTVCALIWFYVFCDDVWQHHHQVNHPEYHSPVHNWYVGYFYVSNSWIARAVRKLNEWADGR